MTGPDQEVVAEVKAFLARHDATATSVKPSGLQEVVDDATTPVAVAGDRGVRPAGRTVSPGVGQASLRRHERLTDSSAG